MLQWPVHGTSYKPVLLDKHATTDASEIVLLVLAA